MRMAPKVAGVVCFATLSTAVKVDDYQLFYQFGNPTTNISNSVGVFTPAIYDFCAAPEIGEEFSFPDFSASTAGLLLPWIAFFAQLPRQTGSSYNDILSIFISVGSLAWISSSVFLAVFFRRAVSTRFNQLQAKFISGANKSIYLHLAKRCEAAKIILQAGIQASMRLNPRPGFLSSLIISPENHWWWIAAAADIKALWRRIDAVFIAQTFIAALAWLLAIITNFSGLPGSVSSSNSAEWQICMGTLWLWLFTATYGPIAIESLYKAKVLRHALSSPGETYDRFHFALINGKVAEQHEQTAIVQRSALVPKYLINRRGSTQVYGIMNEDREASSNVRIPDMWGLSIEGAGRKEGLNTFPCKFFPSEQLVDHVVRPFESFHQRLEHDQAPVSNKDDNLFSPKYGSFDLASRLDSKLLDLEAASPTTGRLRPVKTWDSTKSPTLNLKGSSQALDEYLGIEVSRFTAYPKWSEVVRGTWMRFIMANILGLVVQWGTSGPGIYVMYYTPPVGLGCDSGGLLIYAVGATLSWALLNLGSLLSHTALLHYQRYHDKFPSQPILDCYKRTYSHTFLCGAAVITRVLGKLVAVINACWILVWSFLTYTNVMQTPYCTTAYFSLRNRGWMRLWNFESQQYMAIRIQELQCLVFGTFIAYFACVLISALTSNEKKRQCRWTVTAVLSLAFPTIAILLYSRGVRSVMDSDGGFMI
ncbi:uncharacterized protein LY89DRAFT_783227 [Mollisia scopiformis]|uniref:Uncharacterized protein n=1 Tax=Mollisia scopiformis TaxID=149040 RepID=A0A194X7C5_MOLSC|nr:uncharacterized protein LY89DRAFT_783227 [Mollisia scopiformis]KUJ15989.1 hypothetical protein LY89DRAFT_783227 [Mollisia scopiformis]